MRWKIFKIILVGWDEQIPFVVVCGELEIYLMKYISFYGSSVSCVSIHATWFTTLRNLMTAFLVHFSTLFSQFVDLKILLRAGRSDNCLQYVFFIRHF